MGDFFEKLKKGMGVEVSEEKEEKPKKEIKKIKMKTIPIEEKKEKQPISKPTNELFEEEGKLAIDVCQTDKELVIVSAIAGVRPENLDITLEKDVLTIKGVRKKPLREEGDYFTKECYWGAFSREIILPVEIDPNRISATLNEGILTIRMPKIQRERKRKIVVKEEA